MDFSRNMCVVSKMSHVFVFLLGVVACVKATLLCPIPDYPLCGNDGQTYNNICEYQIAKILNPQLELLYLGSCKGSPYGFYRALLQDNRDLLRSRKRRKTRKHKRLSGTNNDYDDDSNIGGDFIQRLADMQFNFRRDQERDEEQQED